MMRGLLGLAAAAAVAAGVAAGEFDAAEPDPSLSPEEVVRIQVGALGNNDEPAPDRGIEITFRFASPANKVMTGPIERFMVMIHSPHYEPMIDHRSASFENVVVDGDNAAIDVIVLTKDNAFLGYRFTLSRQLDGGCVGCWMTDSVAPFPVEMS